MSSMNEGNPPIAMKVKSPPTNAMADTLACQYTHSAKVYQIIIELEIYFSFSFPYFLFLCVS